MKKYRVLFSFMRGRRGETVPVSDEHAPALIAAGLIEPIREGTAEARETKVVTPEPKEGSGDTTRDAAEPRRAGRQRRAPENG